MTIFLIHVSIVPYLSNTGFPHTNHISDDISQIYIYIHIYE